MVFGPRDLASLYRRSSKPTKMRAPLAPPSLKSSMRKRAQRSHPERAESSKEEHELLTMAGIDAIAE